MSNVGKGRTEEREQRKKENDYVERGRRRGGGDEFRPVDATYQNR